MKRILHYCGKHHLRYYTSCGNGTFTMHFYSIVDEFRLNIQIPKLFFQDDSIEDREMVSNIIKQLHTELSCHNARKMAAENGVIIDSIPVDHAWADDKHNAEYDDLYFQKKELKLGDVLPYIGMNDIQINDARIDDDRLVLINRKYNNEALSDKFLNAKVKYIQNDECIPDTIIIGVSFVGDTDDNKTRYNKNWRNKK